MDIALRKNLEGRCFLYILCFMDADQVHISWFSYRRRTLSVC